MFLCDVTRLSLAPFRVEPNPPARSEERSKLFERGLNLNQS